MEDSGMAQNNIINFNDARTAAKNFVDAQKKQQEEKQSAFEILLSEVEISGDTDFSLLGEGTQYSQYITPTNRYKLPQYSQYSAQSNIWWTRTADKTFSNVAY